MLVVPAQEFRALLAREPAFGDFVLQMLLRRRQAVERLRRPSHIHARLKAREDSLAADRDGLTDGCSFSLRSESSSHRPGSVTIGCYRAGHSVNVRHARRVRAVTPGRPPAHAFPSPYARLRRTRCYVARRAGIRGAGGCGAPAIRQWLPAQL